MTTPLWPHQQAAVDQLLPLGSGMLAISMGGGKTRTALELLQQWKCRRVLILCPKSVVQVWPQEFRKHLGAGWDTLPLDAGTVAARDKLLRRAWWCADMDGSPLAVAINYEASTCAPLGDKGPNLGTLRELPWDALILDESHRLKSPTGRQSQFVARLAKGLPHVLALTGTPMPHSPLDIWAQFRAIKPGTLEDSYYHFAFNYTITKERKRRDGRKFKEIIGYQRLNTLQDRIAPYVYRVRAEDVLDLPETQDVHRYCLLGPAALRVYRDLEDGLAAQIGAGTVSAGNALVKLLRLAQVANGGTVDDETAAYTQLGTEKADLLRETLEDLDPEEPVVVFGRFHTDLDSIHEVAASLGRTSAELSGRRNDLAGWQEGASNVLAVQLQAGGLGVDFTRARVQVYYALDYSLGDYLQTRKRIHRPGQTRAVLYVHLLAAGTVDEAVYAALAKRQEVVDAVVDGLRGRREKSA